MERKLREALGALDDEHDPEVRRVIESYIDNIQAEIDNLDGRDEPEYHGLWTRQMKFLWF